MVPHALHALTIPPLLAVVPVPHQLPKLLACARLTSTEMPELAIWDALLVLVVVLLLPKHQRSPLTPATARVQRCGMDFLQGPQQEPHARYARHAARILLLV
jgi:hypothetical protein